jgi:hypothetical protein
MSKKGNKEKEKEYRRMVGNVPVPERGIFWEVDCTTEDSSEGNESMDHSSSDEPEDW